MKKIVTFGEIMMRLAVPGNARFTQAEHLEVTYGGGEANVSVAAAQLGLAAEHVTCFPDNDLGKAARGFYQKYGVGFENTPLKGERLGLYFLEVGAGMRPSRIIYDRFDSAFANLEPDWFDWKKIFHGADWFHWTGITPAISANAASVCQEAIVIAKEMGLRVSADVNYRRNLWRYGNTAQEVMPTLVQLCDTLVCTQGDAEDIFGIKSTSFEDMAQQMLDRFSMLHTILATRRETISASHNRLTGLAYTREGMLETPTYDINPIVDRIGGGDAFIGGYVFGLHHFDENQAQALHFATAASALKHLVPGDFFLGNVAEVEAVMAGETSGRLLR
jgi:2-dehydro-3-deoxygluconokinase